MAKYIHYDYNQNLMIAINRQDQLQAGTFEHALHYLVTKKLHARKWSVLHSNIYALVKSMARPLRLELSGALQI